RAIPKSWFAISRRLKLAVTRIALEAAPLSQWVHAGLLSEAHPAADFVKIPLRGQLEGFRCLWPWRIEPGVGEHDKLHGSRGDSVAITGVDVHPSEALGKLQRDLAQGMTNRPLIGHYCPTSPPTQQVSDHCDVAKAADAIDLQEIRGENQVGDFFAVDI